MCLVGQCVTFAQCKAQLELLDDVVTDATTAKVLLADGNAVDVVLQNFVEVLTRPLVHDKHRLTFALLTFLVVSQLTLLYLDIIFLRQPAQRLRIGNLLMFHEKVDGIATFSTGKTLAYLSGGRHHERRCLVVVERTQPLVVHACLTQVHELAYHINNIGGFHDFIYRRSVNHDAKVQNIS